MTMSRVDLESFEDDLSVPRKESTEYLRGFEAGTLSSQSSEAAMAARALEAIATNLSDLNFGYAEARLQLLERTRPLFAQIADLILPSIARTSFSAHIVDVLQDAFDDIIDQPIQIAVHPDLVSHLSEQLSGQDTDFVFLGDANLSEGQALLRHDYTQVLIDIPALLTALQTALNGLEPLERSLSNG